MRTCGRELINLYFKNDFRELQTQPDMCSSLLLLELHLYTIKLELITELCL